MLIINRENSTKEGRYMAAISLIRMGHPTLRKIAQLVTLTELESSEFKTLLANLYDTMKVEGGIGIAAPQINISKQVALIELPQKSERYGTLQESGLFIIINPQITIIEHELQGFWEGCLSLPGLRGFVERPKVVQIDYLNEQGIKKTFVAENFLAAVFQHELDHLFGKLYIDQITDTTKLSYIEEFTEFNAINKKEDLNIE
jgi:peptide deformylase